MALRATSLSRKSELPKEEAPAEIKEVVVEEKDDKGFYFEKDQYGRMALKKKR